MYLCWVANCHSVAFTCFQDNTTLSRHLSAWRLQGAKKCANGLEMIGGSLRSRFPAPFIFGSATCQLWLLLFSGTCQSTNATKTKQFCPAYMTCFWAALMELIVSSTFCVYTATNPCLIDRLRMSTPLMKQGERFVVGVVGVHFAGPKRRSSECV